VGNNPLAMMNDEQRRRVIAVAMRRHGKELLPYMSEVSFPGFRSARLAPEPLLVRHLVNEASKSLPLSMAILKAWFEENSALRVSVGTSLESHGYRITQPDFSGFSWQNLQQKDIRVENNLTYFQPEGDDMSLFDPFDVTLMALLLGWFVTDE